MDFPALIDAAPLSLSFTNPALFQKIKSDLLQSHDLELDAIRARPEQKEVSICARITGADLKRALRVFWLSYDRDRDFSLANGLEWTRPIEMLRSDVYTNIFLARAAEHLTLLTVNRIWDAAVGDGGRLLAEINCTGWAFSAGAAYRGSDLLDAFDSIAYDYDEECAEHYPGGDFPDMV